MGNIIFENGKLSPVARKMMTGILDMADALTTFGNTIPTSYLRLVPNQEAPTRICWGERNRSALVRVPLGWTGKQNMAAKANPDINVSAKNGIFPTRLIDFTIDSLTAFQDKNLSCELAENPEGTRELVIRYIHCQ